MNFQTKCPSCKKLHEVDSQLKGRHGRCSSCGEKFLIEPYVAQHVEHKSVSVPVIVKKSNAGVATLVALAAVITGGYATYKYSGLFDKKPPVETVKEEGNKAEEDAKIEKKSQPLAYLNNVTERSVFEPSPVKIDHQWQYARVAKTYPNDAGMYPLLAGNAETIPSANPQRDPIQYKLQHDALVNWHNVGDKAKWQLAPAVVSGKYQINLFYGAADECAGNEYKIQIGEKSFPLKVRSTGGYGHIWSHHAANLEIKEGQALGLSMEATKINPGTGLMDLRAIEIVPEKSQHRWFDVVTGKWTDAIPQSLRHGSGKTCDPTPPVHLIKGGPKGYAVITTKAIRDKSKTLSKFVAHKKGLGYDTMVITEDDFGGGKGPDAFDNIRKWLHQNYKAKNLLYVLFIGDPNPATGDIPMPAVLTNMHDFRARIAQGEHPRAVVPSDTLYMDCSGHTVDLDGNGIYGSGGDFDPGRGGLDSVYDVLVGRINYYGEHSAWGKVADVDAILQKTINYENATPEEIYERYAFEIDGFILDGHVTEWGGFKYFSREQSHRGRLTPDHPSWQNNSFMDQYNTGFLRSGGHASPTYIESGVTSGWLAGRTPPKDTLNVVAVYGGCDCSQPEHPMNMGYMHLRKGAIVTAGASRSVASMRGYGDLVRPAAFNSMRTTPLKRGVSVGQSHWLGVASSRRVPNKSAQMWTLYGDPSIVPFPERLSPTRNHAIRPVHALEYFEPMDVDPALAKHSQEYDVQNLSGRTQPWSVSTKADWLTITTPQSGTLENKKIATVRMQLNEKSLQLPVGRSKAKLVFDIGGNKEVRVFEFIRTIPELTRSFTFGNKSQGKLNPSRDGKTNVIGGYDYNDFVNRTVTFEITPHGKLQGHILAGASLALSVNTNQTLNLHWQPYRYGGNGWGARFLGVGNGPEDPISVKGKDALEQGKVNVVSISTNYQTQKVSLYLNGRLQGSDATLGHMFLPFQTDIMPVNASIDNFYLFDKALTADDALSTYQGGFAVSTPSPAFMRQGVNRLPLLAWRPIDSSMGVAQPHYQIRLGKSPNSLTKIATTTEKSYKVEDTLSPSTKYYWRVDIAAADGSIHRKGDVWNFTTGKTISRDVIPYPSFAQRDKWHIRAAQQSNNIGFKNYGDFVAQKVNPRDLKAGGYKLIFKANSAERLASRPLWLIIHGQDENGQNKEFHREVVEFNDSQKGVLESYFKLENSLTDARHAVVKLQLPGNGGRCPYWVFATEMSLMNNVDFSALPNRAPKFTQHEVTLPNMPAQDNSYAYQFKNLVEDESPNKLSFRMLEGPSWVTVQASGRVFSYHGAPVGAIGRHRMKVEVTDEEGLTDIMYAILNVKQPGELSLLASEAILPQGKQIRLTGNMLTHIIDDEATATWNFKPALTGTYKVYLHAGSPDENIGRVKINGQSKEFTIKNTGGYKNIQGHGVGEFKLKKGENAQLTLEVVRRKEGLCDVSHIHIVPDKTKK